MIWYKWINDYNPPPPPPPSIAGQLRQDVEGVTAKLRYLSEAHHTVRDDIALTKRASEKATSDVSKAQDEKLEQVQIYCIELDPISHSERSAGGAKKKASWILLPSARLSLTFQHGNGNSLID